MKKLNSYIFLGIFLIIARFQGFSQAESGNSYTVVQAAKDSTKEHREDIIAHSLMLLSSDSAFSKKYVKCLVTADSIFSNLSALPQPVQVEYGDFKGVKSILNKYLHFQQADGSVYNKQNNNYLKDRVTSAFVIIAGIYIKQSGDLNWLQTNWLSIHKSIEFCLTHKKMEVLDFASYMASAMNSEADLIRYRDIKLADKSKISRNSLSDIQEAATPKDVMWLRHEIDTLLGMDPDAINQILNLNPCVPAPWDRFQVNNIKVGKHLLQVLMEKKGKLIIWTFTQNNDVPLLIRFKPVFPAETQITHFEYFTNESSPFAKEYDQQAGINFPCRDTVVCVFTVK